MEARAVRLMMKLYAILMIAGSMLQASEPGKPQPTRAEALENKFLAPCCYAEPLARHRSPTAQEMKGEIRTFIAAGKSDREIIDFYKQQYGARILVEPEGALWWWMHVIPWVITALGAAFTIWLIRRMLRPAAQNATAQA